MQAQMFSSNLFFQPETDVPTFFAFPVTASNKWF